MYNQIRNEIQILEYTSITRKITQFVSKKELKILQSIDALKFIHNFDKFTQEINMTYTYQ